MRLLTVDQVPDYIIDNDQIIYGYRPTPLTFTRACFSIFEWHNETLNIWSHLLATVLFVWLLLSATEWPTIIFLCASTCLFATSAAFHTLLCMNKFTYDKWRKYDFITIAVLMWSMFVPYCFYSFDQITFTIYMVLATAIASACIAVTLKPAFSTNEFHVYRPLVFGTLGLLGAIVIVHGYTRTKNMTTLLLCLTQLVACLAGAIFYAYKWPEKRGHEIYSFVSSHVMFHVCVVLGIFCFYLGVEALKL